MTRFPTFMPARLITASARSWARKETPMQMTLILCFGGFEFVSRSGIGGVRLWHFPPSDVMSASCPRAYGVARPPAHPVWPGGCPRGDGLLTLGKRGGGSRRLTANILHSQA